MYVVWIQRDKTIEGMILATSHGQAYEFVAMLRRLDVICIYDIRTMQIDTLTELLAYVAEENKTNQEN